MSRQDANAAFALTSFLYGANAPYIEDLYAALRDRSEIGRRRMAVLLSKPEGRPARGQRECARSLMAARRLAAAGAQRTDRGARRRLDRGRQGARRQGQGQGPDQGRRAFRRRRRARHARFDPRADADPRLSRARPFPRQSRSARARAAAARRRSSIRRPTASREADFDRPIFLDNVLGLEFGTMRQIIAILRRTYCQTLGVEFLHISDARAEGLDSGAHRRARQGDHLHPRGQARDPQQAGRGRRLREILRREIHRHQALRPRRRRIDDPGARADHQARRRARRAGDRDRHGRIAAGSTCWRK